MAAHPSCWLVWCYAPHAVHSADKSVSILSNLWSRCNVLPTLSSLCNSVSNLCNSLRAESCLLSCLSVYICMTGALNLKGLWLRVYVLWLHVLRVHFSVCEIRVTYPNLNTKATPSILVPFLLSTHKPSVSVRDCTVGALLSTHNPFLQDCAAGAFDGAQTWAAEQRDASAESPCGAWVAQESEALWRQPHTSNLDLHWSSQDCGCR